MDFVGLKMVCVPDCNTQICQVSVETLNALYISTIVFLGALILASWRHKNYKLII